MDDLVRFDTELVKKLRREKGWTQAELAEQMGSVRGWELLSNLVYGRAESGGFPTGLPFIDAIDELHLGDQVSELTEPPEPSPSLLSAHGQLMHQAQGGGDAEAVPGLDGS